MKTVFVDTSGFYGLLDPTDPFHQAARQCFQEAQKNAWRLVTTSYVVHESWAVIQARLGWEAVNAWLDRVLPTCEIAWVDQRLHELGAARCRQARERRLSLTDCVSIEWMRRQQIDEAVADDEHFRREGFHLPS